MAVLVFLKMRVIVCEAVPFKVGASTKPYSHTSCLTILLDNAFWVVEDLLSLAHEKSTCLARVKP